MYVSIYDYLKVIDFELYWLYTLLKESILLRVKAKDTSPPSGALNILKFTPGELNIYIQNPNENRDDLMNKLTAGTVEVENQKQKTSPLNRIAQRSWAAQCKRKKLNHVLGLFTR